MQITSAPIGRLGPINSTRVTISYSPPRKEQEQSSDTMEISNDSTSSNSTAKSLIIIPDQKPIVSGATSSAAGAVKRGRRRLLHDEAQRNDRRKLQCKLNQRRYRARQRGMISSLSLEKEKNKEYMEVLQSYHQVLCACNTATTVGERARVAIEYFCHIFTHGFALHAAEISELQERFLRFLCAPNLITQGLIDPPHNHKSKTPGIDALLLQLKRYSSYHATFLMEVHSISVSSATFHSTDPSQHLRPRRDYRHRPIVHVRGSMKLRVSRDTVMLLFPHIIPNEALGYAIVGHEIQPTFTMVFHMNEIAVVEHFELHVDFTSAYMKLVNNPDAVSTIMEKALISPYSELGSDPQGLHGNVPNVKGDNRQLSLEYILL